MSYFKLPPWYLTVETEENHNDLSGGSESDWLCPKHNSYGDKPAL
jgi:hypothetical protein